MIREALERSAVLLFAVVSITTAQAPTGSVAGVVRDSSGATIAAAQVKIHTTSTGLTRTIVTSVTGDYSFPFLLAGEYEISVESIEFQRAVRKSSVEAGQTTTADFTLTIGDVKEAVNVDAATPQMQYDSNTLRGVVTRPQIEGLPLNGRSFLELAKLEPGVQPPSRSNNNRTFVPILGGPGSNTGSGGRGTRVTVDGGSIVAVGSFGSQMGFSQEVVQEFQISAANFDLSTGITDAGAVNVVTRSGTNTLHGSAFYFFRDHTLAAYPALERDPTNRDPFFQRRQFGFALSGPIRHNRVFFFSNWERNEQRGVVSSTLLDPDFAHLSRITTSPFFGNLFSVRLDGRINAANTVFVRHSHDGSRAFSPSPSAGNMLAGYPSQWPRQVAWVDQSMVGLTSALRPTLVNDLRVSYSFTSTSESAAELRDCLGCLGMEAPAVNIPQAGLFIGNSASGYNVGRRFHLTETVTWQQTTHRARFGLEWEYNRGGISAWANEPATLTLYSPAQARQNNLPIPTSFRSIDDILQLPLRSVAVSVGDPRVPQADGGSVRHWRTARLFVQDTWRVHPGLTANYGLAWSIDQNLNYDLTKPALFAPLLGTGSLGPTRKSWRNFSPVAGLAWAPAFLAKTVIRAGAGLYYEPLMSVNLNEERALLGPPGLGRQLFSGTSLRNILPGIPGVPVGSSLDFRNPALFTGADLIKTLPVIRNGLTQGLANADQTVQAVQLTKQVSGGGVFPYDYKSSSALHASMGVQREIARDFVLSADFAYRHFVHLTLGGGGIDLNRFGSIRGPIIPVCSETQRNDPQAICSRGAINVQQWQGRASYKGLLLRADKRFSHGFQVLGSYAYSSNTGTNNGIGFNLDNWLQNRGPLQNDYTNILNLSAVAQLPQGVDLGLNFAYSSTPPFSAYVGGIDFNGDGTTGDLLPGTTVNAFNRGMRGAELEQFVSQFNTKSALTRDAQGVAIPRLSLPANYAFGDDFHSLDLRLSRSFVFQERWRVWLIGEVFNLYNNANLTGYSGDLTSVAFGQPTSRATQVFGSGGPRAFQLAMRVAF